MQIIEFLQVLADNDYWPAIRKGKILKIFPNDRIKIQFEKSNAPTWADEFGNAILPFSIHKILLDPIVWQILEKHFDWGNPEKEFSCQGWRWHMHDFIDRIIEEETIEKYFEEIETPYLKRYICESCEKRFNDEDLEYNGKEFLCENCYESITN